MKNRLVYLFEVGEPCVRISFRFSTLLKWISMYPSSSFGSQAPDPDADGCLFKRACSGPVYVLPGVETLTEFDVICEFWIRPSDTPTGITSEQSHFLASVVEVVVETIKNKYQNQVLSQVLDLGSVYDYYLV